LERHDDDALALGLGYVEAVDGGLVEVGGLGREVA
jgi:hypothetical protein